MKDMIFNFLQWLVDSPSNPRKPEKFVLLSIGLWIAVVVGSGTLLLYGYFIGMQFSSMDQFVNSVQKLINTFWVLRTWIIAGVWVMPVVCALCTLWWASRCLGLIQGKTFVLTDGAYSLRRYNARTYLIPVFWIPALICMLFVLYQMIQWISCVWGSCWGVVAYGFMFLFFSCGLPLPIYSTLNRIRKGYTVLVDQ